MENQSARIPTLVALATGVGGHFMNGRRRKGYAYFFFLLSWPFALLFGQLALLLGGFESASSPAVVAIIFVIGFASIWTISVVQAINDRRLAVLGDREISKGRTHTWEVAITAIAIYAVALYGIVGFILVPQLPRGERFELFSLPPKAHSSIAGSTARLLPTGEGDLLLLGEVRQSNRALNTRLLLTFREGYRTPEIRTNSNGEFEYRLPPGTWRFAGPLILGQESRPVYVVFTPEIVKPVFQVNVGPPTTKVHMRIVVE